MTIVTIEPVSLNRGARRLVRVPLSKVLVLLFRALLLCGVAVMDRSLRKRQSVERGRGQRAVAAWAGDIRRRCVTGGTAILIRSIPSHIRGSIPLYGFLCSPLRLVGPRPRTSWSGIWGRCGCSIEIFRSPHCLRMQLSEDTPLVMRW